MAGNYVTLTNVDDESYSYIDNAEYNENEEEIYKFRFNYLLATEEKETFQHTFFKI